MENLYFGKEIPQFNSPQEEIEFLKAHIKERESSLSEQGQEKSKEEVAKEAVTAYSMTETESVLADSHQMSQSEQEAVVLRLRPEEHDSTIEELYAILLEKGLKNTLDVIAQMNSPHIEDDFHRFLIQYLYSYHQVPGLQEGSPEYKGLNMVLFEIVLPNNSEDDKDFQQYMGAMEQFYAGMQSLAKKDDTNDRNFYSLEIALSYKSPEVIIYAGIPRAKIDLFEKQLLAYYHDAKITEVTEDYNVFIADGFASGSYATLRKEEALPIAHADFDHDPMNSFINIFSKLEKGVDGASIQFIVTPMGPQLVDRFQSALEKVKKGDKLKDALNQNWGKEFWKTGKEMFTEKKDKDEESDNSDHVALINEKLESSVVSTTIRILASSNTKVRSDAILDDLESVFHQFDRPNSNGFEFKQVREKDVMSFVHKFAYRLPSEEYAVATNLKELSSLFHFPVAAEGAPQLKEAKAGSGPAPIEMGSQGIQLGENIYRGITTPIHFDLLDRMRHFYVIGQTGTGKTTILKSMIIQDIKNGEGVCFIDPHGTDIQDIMSHIPKDRIDDVIYFDPAYTARPMALNMLEYDVRYPEQKTFVINELMAIFNQLFDMKSSGGPMFEQYFKNAAGLVMDHPESGSTLLEIGRVLSDKTFRDMKLTHCKNPIIKQFWTNAEKTTGDQGLENFVPYVTSKFDTFISNEIMRPIIAQQDSSFNMRDIMDGKKILLVNLAKGRLGEINSNLIGLLLVGKIQMAALSRVDSFGQDMPPFYLYIDEFQNVTTPSIASILSEARKYKLSLNVAHQYMAQLSDDIRDAILGNVGSMALYRISSDDAKALESRVAPEFSWEDITKIDNFNCYMSMLIDGQPVKPFNMKAAYYPTANIDIVEPLKELSYMKYGKPRDEVEADIMGRFKKI